MFNFGGRHCVPTSGGDKTCVSPLLPSNKMVLIETLHYVRPHLLIILLASCKLSLPHVKFKVLVQKCCKKYLTIILYILCYDIVSILLMCTA